MTEPRLIITLQVLFDTLTNLDKDGPIMKKIISVYAQEYDVALREFDRLYEELAPQSEEAASIWSDFRNSLTKMSTIERNRLRLECRKHLGWIS